MPDIKGKKLSIVIPAYNEEDSIKEIITRCLSAREGICRETGLSSVEVIAVDDGSHDKTREIAESIAGAKVVVHPVNKGYGAALMTGFEAASGDYLSFLDADGTCDPKAFASLCRALKEKDAELVIGNRMHADSRMPRVRYIGNRVYAAIISRLSGVSVGDTASGMRVFSKDLLPRLYPLPTGLHFTPAMTARSACMGARITEVPIPYSERAGESKLNVVQDGLRFLNVILGIIFAYYPLRIFGPAGLAFLGAALAYGIWPVSYYIEHRELLPDLMIYRLLTVVTLAVCGLICLAFGGIAQKLSDIATRRAPGFWDRPGLRYAAVFAGIILVLGGIGLNTRTIIEYISTRTISTHWIYVLTGSLAVISGTVLGSFGITLGLVRHLPRPREMPCPEGARLRGSDPGGVKE